MKVKVSFKTTKRGRQSTGRSNAPGTRLSLVTRRLRHTHTKKKKKKKNKKKQKKKAEKL
jgi:hypothetical protein